MEAHEPQHVNENWYIFHMVVLVWGLETWTLSQLDWRWLDFSYARCRRRILHIRWHDHISRDEVLRRTSLLAASSVVCKRRLGLFGHVARVADDVPANHPSNLLRIWRWCATISRLEACSRLISHHRDSSDLPGHRNTGDALQLAEDRLFWRQIAKAGC